MEELTVMKHINFSSFSTEIGLLTVLNKESKAQVETSEARKQTILNSASGLRPNNGIEGFGFAAS